MAKFETLKVDGWIPAIQGMRAPLKSYNKIDTKIIDNEVVLGENDYKLMKNLCLAGTEHSKWMRQISVWMCVTAPLYFFSEWDTYKISTTANSESRMHTITRRHLSLDDFELRLKNVASENTDAFEDQFYTIVELLNNLIDSYKYYIDNQRILEAQNTFLMIKSILPSSFVQTRFVTLNYAVLQNMYRQRKNHRLPQWSVDFVSWIHSLPYSEFITGEFLDK